MATLGQIGNVWKTKSGEMYYQFLGACLKAAYDVRNEDPGTTNHTARVAWANVILSGVDADVDAKVQAHLRYALASNATIQNALGASTDNDVQFVVNSQIDALA